MGAVNATVTVPASQERLWDVLVTPATYESWLTIHTKWKGEIPERFTEKDAKQNLERSLAKLGDLVG
jgi:uncharacterized protein YndB with AHSA1/START domain